MESRLVNSSTKVLLGDDRLQFTQYLLFYFMYGRPFTCRLLAFGYKFLNM
ncbi:hypothetical protein NC651_016431 [Populus alba x Populus x berolinensis]|nr:hypothetical protein NC651_016431 [Populus alba x Populus x berolinensis]